MAETLTIRTASSTEVIQIASVGPQGPKGDKGDPGDVAGLPLSTQGDLLYRGASENQRLPIGSTGQVLKVSGGIPSWANESGAVTSVNGATGAVTVAVPSASSTTPAALGTAAAGSSANYARADHVHATPNVSALLSTGAGEGDLPVAQGDGTIFWQNGTTWAGMNITAADVSAATASHVHGNITNDGKVGSTSGRPLVTTTAGAVTTLALGTANQILRVNSGATAVEFADPAASGVTSVTGTAPIVSSGGTTPAISISAATTSAAGSMSSADKTKMDGIATGATANSSDATLLSRANHTGTQAVGTITGLGGAATLSVGTTAGTVAAGDDSRFHTRSHAMTGTSDHTASNWSVFYSNGSGQVTELGLGASGTILTSAGATSAPTFSAPASGGTKTYATFTATDNQPPASAFATLDTRNSIAVLDFDAATDENAVFVGIMPEAASLGSGLIVRLHWMATTATSGNVRWGVQFERSNTDLDADSFDTAVEATAAANGTSGILTTTAITVTTIDGLTAGDVFRLKVFRNADDATNDTMTGDAELVAVEIRSAA